MTHAERKNRVLEWDRDGGINFNEKDGHMPWNALSGARRVLGPKTDLSSGTNAPSLLPENLLRL
jgi:hypothetical protein